MNVRDANAPEPLSIPVKRDDVVPQQQKPVPTKHERRVQQKPVPREGFPKQLYDLQQVIAKVIPGFDPEIPDMNAVDRAKYDFERQLERIIALEDSFRHLTIKYQRRVTVVNSKGGVGKTPLMANLACIAQQVSRDPYLFIDANENVGTAHRFFGVERADTILLRQAVATRTLLGTFSLLSERTAKHLETGVRIIGSDFRTEGLDTFSLEAYQDMVRITDSTVHSTFMDTGNGFNNVSNIGSVAMANVLVFPALADKPASFDGLALTMLKYMEMGFTEKVKNGFVVINATQPGATKQEYLDKIQDEFSKNPFQKHNPETGVTADAYLTLEDMGISEERMFLIPSSQHIAEYGVVSTDPAVLGYDTYEAFLSLLVAMYRQNASYQAPSSRR